MRRSVVPWWLVLGVLLCGVARAEEPEAAPTPDVQPADPPPTVPPTHRFWYRNSLFARVNPLGLQNITDLGWRYQLVRKTGLLFGDSYLFLGASVNLSPSFFRGGLKAEVMPISILRLSASWQPVVYTGAFDNLTSFRTGDDDFSDRAMGERGDAYAATGHVVELSGRLQAKVSYIAVRDTLALSWYQLALRDGDAFFYEQFWDRMAPDGGWIVQNDLDVLGVIGKAKFGVRYTYSDSLIGDGSAGDLPNHRVGPLFAWEFHDRRPGARFNHPTLFVLAQWWAQHVWRTGEQQPAGLPLIAVGLTFDGDIVGERPPRSR